MRIVEVSRGDGRIRGICYIPCAWSLWQVMGSPWERQAAGATVRSVVSRKCIREPEPWNLTKLWKNHHYLAKKKMNMLHQNRLIFNNYICICEKLKLHICTYICMYVIIFEIWAYISRWLSISMFSDNVFLNRTRFQVIHRSSFFRHLPYVLLLFISLSI